MQRKPPGCRMCDCTSCAATNDKERWKQWRTVAQVKLRTLDHLPPEQYPPSKLAGMDRYYKAHAAYALRGGLQRLIPPSAFANPGAGFYGVPAGSTRAQVAEVLARTFAASRHYSSLSTLAQRYRAERT